MGDLVGNSGARKVEHVIDGTREYTYVDDQLVLLIDRDPKYKLDFDENKPEIAKDNPYVKFFLGEELTHNEGTLFKVRDALQRVGLDEQQIIDCIFDMQNNGLYFREAAKNE